METLEYRGRDRATPALVTARMSTSVRVGIRELVMVKVKGISSMTVKGTLEMGTVRTMVNPLGREMWGAFSLMRVKVTLETGTMRRTGIQSAMGIARCWGMNGEKFGGMASRKDSEMTAGQGTVEMNETGTAARTAGIWGIGSTGLR